MFPVIVSLFHVYACPEHEYTVETCPLAWALVMERRKKRWTWNSMNAIPSKAGAGGLIPKSFFSLLMQRSSTNQWLLCENTELENVTVQTDVYSLLWKAILVMISSCVNNCYLVLRSLFYPLEQHVAWPFCSFDGNMETQKHRDIPGNIRKRQSEHVKTCSRHVCECSPSIMWDTRLLGESVCVWYTLLTWQ